MVLTRTIAAPRERVWRAWSDPDQVRMWWGPKGSRPRCAGWTSAKEAQHAREHPIVSPVDPGLPSSIPGGVRHIVMFVNVDDVTTELMVQEFACPDEQMGEVWRAGTEHVLDKPVAMLTGA